VHLNKTTGAISLLLLTLAVFIGIQLAPKSNPDKFFGNPILDSKKLIEVSKIKIAKDGVGFEMVKDARGEWVLPAERNFPVSAYKVTQLLDYMMGQKITQPLAMDPRDLSMVGLDKPMTVSLSTDKGPLVELGIGDLRKQAGQYVYVGDTSHTYLIEYQFELKADSKEWWQRDLWSIPEEKIRSLQVSFPANPTRPVVKLYREKEKSDWKLDNLPPGKPMLPHLRIGFVDSMRIMTFYEKQEMENLASKLARRPDVTLDIVQFDDAHFAIDVFRFPKEKAKQETPAWVRARLVSRSVASTLPPDMDPSPHWKQWYFRLYDGVFDKFDVRPVDFAVPKKH
jgi:hypothetical protein